MIRTTYINTFVLVALVFTGCQLKEAPSPDANLEGKRPNILFVISDDQSYPYASAYGEGAVQTPAFDRVAKEGLLFTRAFVASPGCSPSRAALLTGLNCWQLREAGTHASSFPREFAAFPDLLEEAGYYTGFTGKGWGPGNYKASGRERNPAGRLFRGRELKSPRDISTTDYAANFADFLEGKPGEQPFFFWLGTHEPHRRFKKGIGKENGMIAEKVRVPAFLPDVEEVRSDLLDYGFEIQWFDKQLQKTISLLEEAGELDNTLIVVTSDNGMPFPRAKANVYEYGIHVPLAVRWGNEIKGGRTSDDLVSLIDLYATFLDLAGAAYPEYKTASRSLLNIFSSDKSGIIDSTRTAVFASRERHSSSRWNNLGYPQRCIRTAQYLYIRNFKPDRWPAGAPPAFNDIDQGPERFIIRFGEDPRYAEYFRLATAKRPAEELYDIAADPACLHNLAESPRHDSVLHNLRGRLGAYLMQTLDPRVSGNGDVFESYTRLVGEIREFPQPGQAAPEE
ncbi:putative sulfatase [Anseongella ginsenosidimutans]|uniref:Putative sulfatase n=1 Tax=Anseongella ginsenosidimutans TaxID=496056 RepID=A0A4R3KWZ4_9SPHI|nr:sulfatase [Anseongella ginsenosidimutans]QEC51153.1 sulfatase [Anseongella ginsenosidimutans]TCS90175.1 putative sulfatase [Anseongella ginsenosidimutans]